MVVSFTLRDCFFLSKILIIIPNKWITDLKNIFFQEKSFLGLNKMYLKFVFSPHMLQLQCQKYIVTSFFTPVKHKKQLQKLHFDFIKNVMAGNSTNGTTWNSLAGLRERKNILLCLVTLHYL